MKTSLVTPPAVEKGPSIGSFGARISMFFSRGPRLSSGLEVGYSQLADRSAPSEELESNTQHIGFSKLRRTMFHATFGGRREWGAGNLAGLYLGGGTGLYLFKNSNDVWQTATDFATTRSRSLQVGLNVGGGLSLRALGGPRAIDLDARWHLLPFAGSDLRSVLTISAGLSFH